MATKSTKGTWKPQTEYVTLPSGQQPRIRRIDVISLIMEDGNVPDNVMNLITSGGDLTELKGEDTTAFVRLMNETCRQVFVEPRIVDNPDYDSNEIRVTDVEFRDKLYLWQHLMGGATQQVARFPEEQNPSGDAAPAREILREAAE